MDRAAELRAKIRVGVEGSEVGETTKLDGKKTRERKKKVGEAIEALKAEIGKIVVDMARLESEGQRGAVVPTGAQRWSQHGDRNSVSVNDVPRLKETLWRLWRRETDGNVIFETNAKSLGELYSALAQIVIPSIPPHITMTTPTAHGSTAQHDDHDSSRAVTSTRSGDVRFPTAMIFTWLLLFDDRPFPTSMTLMDNPAALALEHTLLSRYVEHRCCGLLRVDLFDGQLLMQRHENGKLLPILTATLCAITLCYVIPAHHCHDLGDFQRAADGANAYYWRAQDMMNDAFDEIELSTVQTAAMLAWYGAAKRHNVRLNKQIAGLCLQLAYGLGLHQLSDERASQYPPEELEEMRATWYFIYHINFVGALQFASTFFDDTELRIDPPRNLKDVDPDTYVARTFWGHYVQLLHWWKPILMCTLEEGYNLDDLATASLEADLMRWYDSIPSLWRYSPTVDYARWLPLKAQVVLTLRIHVDMARFFRLKPFVDTLDIAGIRTAREAGVGATRVMYSRLERVLRSACEIARLCRMLIVRIRCECFQPKWIFQYSSDALMKVLEAVEGGLDSEVPRLRAVVERDLKWNLVMARRANALHHDREGGEMFLELMKKYCTTVRMEESALQGENEDELNMDEEEVEMAVQEMKALMQP